MMCSLLVIVTVYIANCNGFLFDDLTTPQTNSGSSLTDKHFVALVDMITQERQSREIYMLQLKQKVLENENKASKLEVTINKMNSDNGTVVDKSEFINLKTEFLQKYQSLEQNCNSLQQKYVFVLDENDKLKLQVSSSERAINQMKQELSELKKLTSINELQDIQSLKNENAMVKKQINGLMSTQQARGQDFLALYNQTIDIKTKIKTLDKEIIQQNQTSQLLAEEKARLESELNQLEQSTLNNISEVKSLILQNSEKVAVTSCTPSGNYVSQANVPLPFPSIITSYGMKSLSSLQQSGLFTCESTGLYIVSVTITSNRKSGIFNVYKNNDSLVEVYMQDNDANWHGSSTMVVVFLKIGDQISIKPHFGSTVYSFADAQVTCLTVVKVK